MTKIYYDSDAELDFEGTDRGSYGLRQSGSRPGPKLKRFRYKCGCGAAERKPRRAGEAAGLKVMTVAEAAQAADVIQILLPDEKQREVYEAEIKTLFEGRGRPVLFPWL